MFQKIPTLCSEQSTFLWCSILLEFQNVPESLGIPVLFRNCPWISKNILELFFRIVLVTFSQKQNKMTFWKKLDIAGAFPKYLSNIYGSRNYNFFMMLSVIQKAFLHSVLFLNVFLKTDVTSAIPEYSQIFPLWAQELPTFLCGFIFFEIPKYSRILKRSESTTLEIPVLFRNVFLFFFKR